MHYVCEGNNALFVCSLNPRNMLVTQLILIFPMILLSTLVTCVLHSLGGGEKKITLLLNKKKGWFVVQYISKETIKEVWLWLVFLQGLQLATGEETVLCARLAHPWVPFRWVPHSSGAALNASPPRQVGIRGQTHETKYNDTTVPKGRW